MKTSFLLPHYFLRIGLILFLPALALGITVVHFDFSPSFLTVKDFWSPDNTSLFFTDENFTNEIAGVSFLISLVFIGFARQKIEDEYIMKIRLESLMWGVYIYSGLLFLSLVFIYGGKFFGSMMYLLYAPLMVYILRFYIYLARR